MLCVNVALLEGLLEGNSEGTQVMNLGLYFFNLEESGRSNCGAETCRRSII